MIFLSLSIVSSVIIAVLFKIAERFTVSVFPAIIVNYFVAVFWGLLFDEKDFDFQETLSVSWLAIGLAIGIILIVLFFVIAYSIKKIGITKTIISAKMSVVLPIGFSILYFGEVVDYVKIIGIISAVSAIFLTIYRSDSEKFDKKFIVLPILLFLGMGTIDLLIKYTQQTFLKESDVPLFTLVSFSSAGILGLIFASFKPPVFREILKLKTILFGFLLGSANFGSMYFLILALQKTHIGSSAVFGINNVGIILFSVLIAYVIFREKISRINWFGILLSALSVLLLSRIIE
jgi:drug/metabolite transporter (DMT)-like permease